MGRKIWHNFQQRRLRYLDNNCTNKNYNYLLVISAMPPVFVHCYRRMMLSALTLDSLIHWVEKNIH